MSDIKKVIGNIFEEIATGLETGAFTSRPRIAVTTLGSEHGLENVVKGAELAQSRDKSVEYCIIGPEVETTLKQYVVANEDEGYAKMEELLDSGEIDGCVTMHYSFPIGVSTVGRVVTPAAAKEMIIATTTGTSSAHRVEGMVKNGIYGIIVAKALGIENPTVGILNLDNAVAVEKAFKELKENGYDINFAESNRADGGVLMRGNDLLQGVPDVMVNDTLTGNLLMKVFSSYTTGGGFEAMGYGYGPGIGEGYDRLVLIISRASGFPVIANAMTYAGQLVKGNIKEVSKKEFEKANKAGLKAILEKITSAGAKKSEPAEEVTCPPEEQATATISGIDILELEDAKVALWKHGIFAKTGMGCTGPVVMVNEANLEKSKEILEKEGYV
ncbi:MAG: glycine/sarcosine/betaine reductase complex component C subunit alpha [Peptoniphilaceae bacterium]|uniref:glycine/sarcosine/betaine reductase complex component C subunit alpha n=1 Tax=Parvimonas sp. TaxID=1944660 RepID=UPI0025DF25EF|nr:glycine/sarcosine/betaine reductase complex component C subunit alpha [Parvimonas sp.]MCI5996975.1 glycine/sarcosine/betaine reductase complex component C subunit alpha [Parvimonas sp.]MDD7765061.1 glycine/sarcosine/betaine reductase complex component C subunit alpha [Peptoniphilaceae bacterium]MDY3050255.1 glycine/sarcosine/betaine reductase complex component C subunit alpha [Parvimonas sp.]